MVARPLGTWVAAFILGELVCAVPPGDHFLFLAQDLIQSWPFGFVFPIWYMALCSSSEDIFQPQGESLRNIKRSPGTSSYRCHLGARFPGNATEEHLSHSCSL